MKLRYLLRDLRRALNPQAFLANRAYAGQHEIPWPVPGALLRVRVIASPNLSWYLEYGERNAEALLEILARNGIDVLKFRRILDFGCGSGRILRHLNGRTGAELVGADFNGAAVEWCKRNLPFVTAIHNSLLPPLSLPAGSVDFLYAFSVFTHFTEEMERLWIDEICRILKPGGYFLLTLRGDACIGKLNEGERRLYGEGTPVVRNPEEAGWNQCDSYHPPAHVERLYHSRFELIERLEAPVEFLPFPPMPRKIPAQDLYLLRLPRHTSLRDA